MSARAQLLVLCSQLCRARGWCWVGRSCAPSSAPSAALTAHQTPSHYHHQQLQCMKCPEELLCSRLCAQNSPGLSPRPSLTCPWHLGLAEPCQHCSCCCPGIHPLCAWSMGSSQHPSKRKALAAAALCLSCPGVWALLTEIPRENEIWERQVLLPPAASGEVSALVSPSITGFGLFRACQWEFPAAAAAGGE